MGKASDFSALAPVVSLAQIDSTNDEARRRAETGARGPLWLTAERQTSGRGRYGRTWESASGNLAATFLFSPGLTADACAKLSFVAAMAVVDVLDSYVPGRAQVKWPNDVLIAGSKVAGILLEAGGAQSQGQPEWLAIGIGINLVAAPGETPFPATALADHLAVPPGPATMLAGLNGSLNARLAQFFGEGFAPVREAWLARACGLSGPIHVKLADCTIDGVFEGLDPDGALLVRDGAELRRVRAGEVFF